MAADLQAEPLIELADFRPEFAVVLLAPQSQGFFSQMKRQNEKPLLLAFQIAALGLLHAASILEQTLLTRSQEGRATQGMVLGLILDIAHVQRHNGHAAGGGVVQFHVAVAPHAGQFDARKRRRKLAVGFRTEERQNRHRPGLLGSAQSLGGQVQFQRH